MPPKAPAEEGVLPYVIQVWFIALFVLASHGKSRIVGAVTMSVVLGFEIAGLVGPVVGLDVPSLKVLFLLPFVWLLFESAKRRPGTTPRQEAPITQPAATPGAGASAAIWASNNGASGASDRT
jgi:hypothetical protein